MDWKSWFTASIYRRFSHLHVHLWGIFHVGVLEGRSPSIGRSRTRETGCLITRHLQSEIHRHIWRVPKLVVPPVIIHFNGIFHWKPSIWGYPHGHGNPQIHLGLIEKLYHKDPPSIEAIAIILVSPSQSIRSPPSRPQSSPMVNVANPIHWNIGNISWCHLHGNVRMFPSFSSDQNPECSMSWCAISIQNVPFLRRNPESNHWDNQKQIWVNYNPECSMFFSDENPWVSAGFSNDSSGGTRRHGAPELLPGPTPGWREEGTGVPQFKETHTYMYICLCKCLCICLCICIYVYVYVFVYLYMYMYMYICICIYVYVYVYVYMYMSMYSYMYTCICICKCLYLCIYVYVYMYMYMYM